jgi:hypothetical protein
MASLSYFCCALLSPLSVSVLSVLSCLSVSDSVWLRSSACLAFLYMGTDGRDYDVKDKRRIKTKWSQNKGKMKSDRDSRPFFLNQEWQDMRRCTSENMTMGLRFVDSNFAKELVFCFVSVSVGDRGLYVGFCEFQNLHFKFTVHCYGVAILRPKL